MLGQVFAQSAFNDRISFLVAAMTALHLKIGSTGPGTKESDKGRAENNDRKRNVEKENTHKCSRGKQAHCIVLKRALAYAKYRLQHYSENCRLQSKKQR